MSLLFGMGSPYRSNDSGSLLTRDPLPLAISLADAVGGYVQRVVENAEWEDPSWWDGGNHEDDASGRRGPAVQTAADSRAAAVARPRLPSQSGGDGSRAGSRDGGVARRIRWEDEDSRRNGETCNDVGRVRIRLCCSWLNDSDDTHAQLPSCRQTNRPRSSGSDSDKNVNNLMMVAVDGWRQCRGMTTVLGMETVSTDRHMKECDLTTVALTHGRWAQDLHVERSITIP